MYIIILIKMEYNDVCFYPDDSEVFNSNQKKVETFNRGYNKITRNIVVNNRSKPLEMGVYTSGIQGSSIRNAETGEYYKYTVGSLDENLFYKVSNSTGEFASGPITLFYESPEHYERHQNTEVDIISKRAWNDKKQYRLNQVN